MRLERIQAVKDTDRPVQEFTGRGEQVAVNAWHVTGRVLRGRMPWLKRVTAITWLEPACADAANDGASFLLPCLAVIAFRIRGTWHTR